MGLCGGGHGLGCLATLGLQRGQCGGVALLGSSCGGGGLGLLAGVTLRDDLLLLLVQSSRAFSLSRRWAASISKMACIRSLTSFMQCTSLFGSFTWVGFPASLCEGAKGLFSI